MNTDTHDGKRPVDWRAFIHADPAVLLGKPVVKGTRLAVDFILRLFGSGWTLQEIVDNDPSLTPEAIQAVFAYAGECRSEEALYAMPSAARA